MNKHNILVVVDCQNDFIEGGKLPVNGASEAINNIIKLLNSSDRPDEVIFTVDWHPYNHCSFKENGGEWPMHCVQFTNGAAIKDDLINTCIKNKIPYGVATKGQDPSKENYTAFNFVYENDNIYTYSLAPHFDPEKVTLDFFKDTDDNSEFDDIIVCGLAGDVCVLNTLKVLEKINPKVFLKGIASIDGGKKLQQYINYQGLTIYNRDL